MQDSEVGAKPSRRGGLTYLEIPAVDPKMSAAFYSEVLNWNIEGIESSEPKFSDPTGHLIGRWITGRPITRESGLLPYFYVVCINHAVEIVQKYHGEIIKTPYSEGNLMVATA